MIPVGVQDVRGSGRPWVTWALVGLNVIAFIYELTLGPAQLEQFLMAYGVVPAQIISGKNLVSLLTSMFLYGGLIHVISNVLFLAVFGDNVEDAIKYRELTEKYDKNRNLFILAAGGVWALNLVDTYVIVKNKQKKKLEVKLESGVDKLLAFTISYHF